MSMTNIALGMVIVLMMGTALINRDFEVFNRSRWLRGIVYFARIFMIVFMIAGIVSMFQSNVNSF